MCAVMWQISPSDETAISPLFLPQSPRFLASPLRWFRCASKAKLPLTRRCFPRKIPPAEKIEGLALRDRSNLSISWYSLAPRRTHSACHRFAMQLLLRARPSCARNCYACWCFADSLDRSARLDWYHSTRRSGFREVDHHQSLARRRGDRSGQLPRNDLRRTACPPSGKRRSTDGSSTSPLARASASDGLPR